MFFCTSTSHGTQKNFISQNIYLNHTSNFYNLLHCRKSIYLIFRAKKTASTVPFSQLYTVLDDCLVVQVNRGHSAAPSPPCLLPISNKIFKLIHVVWLHKLIKFFKYSPKPYFLNTNNDSPIRWKLSWRTLSKEFDISRWLNPCS